MTLPDSSTQRDVPTPGWGLLPNDVRAQLHRREWQDTRRLVARLRGERPAVDISLRPPTGGEALDDLAHFRRYCAAWEAETANTTLQVTWQVRRYRQLGEQRVPARLHFARTSELVTFLGPDAVRRARDWEARFAPLLAVDERLYDAAVAQLGTLERMTLAEVERLAQVLPQLSAGLGAGRYLRALPVRGIDTKFVEQHLSLLEALCDARAEGAVHQTGGLLAWLGCEQAPSGWLYVRPLCTSTRREFAGLAIARLPARDLLDTSLPGQRVLIVENAVSGLALPPLDGTTAVFGGGRNTAWSAADWLRGREIGYWGDLDSWGFKCLDDVRRRQPHARSLLMDSETLDAHVQQMGHEAVPCREAMPHLRPEEQAVRHALATGRYPHNRLEQERLAADWVEARLSAW